ncbi:unnamed protein product [Phytophthora fragariaefolia]|uniref:Unnamed protein product n=1 Tax=Phytophthora fragariaefolia TaxID=1490495 RepID=A0A9W6X7J3_9STRA|nr:unnamed protein product [Phytophthora fragariaefolia]
MLSAQTLDTSLNPLSLRVCMTSINSSVDKSPSPSVGDVSIDNEVRSTTKLRSASRRTVQVKERKEDVDLQRRNRLGSFASTHCCSRSALKLVYRYWISINNCWQRGKTQYECTFVYAAFLHNKIHSHLQFIKVLEENIEVHELLLRDVSLEFIHGLDVNLRITAMIKCQQANLQSPQFVDTVNPHINVELRIE